MEMLLIGASTILIAGSVYMLSRKYQNIENQIAKNNVHQQTSE